MDLSVFLKELANYISIITVILLWWQIKQNNKFNKQLHESQRRNNAANILYQWSANLAKEESIAKRIVEQFDKAQVKALFCEADSLIVTQEQYEKMFQIFKCELGTKLTSKRCIKCSSGKECNENESSDLCRVCPNKGKHTLNKNEIILLRWYIMHYLNNLECVLLQCKNGSVDVDIFYEQFRYQYNTRDGVMALKEFREVAGGIESYPAIEWFCANLEERARVKILEKGNVDEEKGFIAKLIVFLEMFK